MVDWSAFFEGTCERGSLDDLGSARVYIVCFRCGRVCTTMTWYFSSVLTTGYLRKSTFYSRGLVGEISTIFLQPKNVTLRNPISWKAFVMSTANHIAYSYKSITHEMFALAGEWYVVSAKRGIDVRVSHCCILQKM